MSAREPSAEPATLAQLAGRGLLITLAVLLLALFLLLPLLAVFVQALVKGFGPFFAALGTEEALAAVRLTLTVAAICVPLNTVFGVMAAWVGGQPSFCRHLSTAAATE